MPAARARSALAALRPASDVSTPIPCSVRRPATALPIAQEREILGPIRDQRQDGGVPLIAGAGVRQLVEFAFHEASRIETRHLRLDLVACHQARDDADLLGDVFARAAAAGGAVGIERLD